MRLGFVFALFLTACFPYRETYRPAIDGVATNAQGQPLADVRVEICTASHWSDRCRFRVSTTTDASGRFHADWHREWEWCCLGEAPLPYVEIAGCSKDGVASAFIGSPAKHADVRLVVAPPPLPVVPPTSTSTHAANDGREPDARAWAMQTCAAPSD